MISVAAILQSHLAARGGRIFSAYFSVNCLLHISINYTENVTDLYAHAQTVYTRRSSPIFQAPGYEATHNGAISSTTMQLLCTQTKSEHSQACIPYLRHLRE